MARNGSSGLWFFVMFLVLVFVFGGCGRLVPESEAVRALETQGFSEVKVTYKAVWFVYLRGCSESDSVKFDMEAINPAGKKVNNIFVCAGWLFKGATVRTK